VCVRACVLVFLGRRDVDPVGEGVVFLVFSSAWLSAWFS